MYNQFFHIFCTGISMARKKQTARKVTKHKALKSSVLAPAGPLQKSSNAVKTEDPSGHEVLKPLHSPEVVSSLTNLV
jgi:hypothetical protein